MIKSLLFKILLVFWALALIVIGVIYYKNSKSCQSCQASSQHLKPLDEYQKKRVQEYKAVLLVTDSGDPIYVDLDEAFTHPKVAPFSYYNPAPLSKAEVEKIMTRLSYGKYVNNMPLKLRSLLSEKKLGVLQSDDGEFFVVALKGYLQEDY